MNTNKTCSKCGADFSCGPMPGHETCWCNRYPPLLAADQQTDCMCLSCLHQAVLEKVNEYSSSMTVEKALHRNPAKKLPATNHFIEGIDYYTEQSFWVFTAWHHLKRGYCCRSGCRHCPYGYRK